jgi:hypothetical protein
MSQTEMIGYARADAHPHFRLGTERRLAPTIITIKSPPGLTL